MKLKVVIIIFYGNGLFVLLDDTIVDQCYSYKPCQWFLVPRQHRLDYKQNLLLRMRKIYLLSDLLNGRIARLYSPRPILVELRNCFTVAQSAVYNSQNVTAASLYYSSPPTIRTDVVNAINLDINEYYRCVNQR